MVAAGDILEFIVETRVNDNPDRFLNVFHYDVLTIEGAWTLAASGQQVADGWAAHMDLDWSNAISTWGTVVGMKINNRSMALEFWEGEFTTPIEGAVSGQTMPPFCAWGFKYQRTTKATRNGAKRIMPVSEDDVLNGVPIETAVIRCNQLAEALADTIAITWEGVFGLTIEPIIVRKDTGFGDIRNPISGVTFERLTTQNTRKLGRGM